MSVSVSYYVNCIIYKAKKTALKKVDHRFKDLPYSLINCRDVSK